MKSRLFRPPTRLRGAAAGLLAAALFGASAPAAKLLLREIGPLFLASLLYLGAGVGLLLLRLVLPRMADPSREARLQRADLPLLLGIVVFGGVAGPLLMLLGLARLSGLAGSLLLNLEAPFTMLLAVLWFGEHVGRRALLGAGLIVLGGVVITYHAGELRADVWGVLAVAGACLSWGIDNNLTQRLSLRNPLAVVRWKTLGAGLAMLVVAVATGASAPSPGLLAAALGVGSLSYGASLLLDTIALRFLGAAHEAAFFATAPFLGAILSIPILGERVSLGLVVAGLVMAAGVLALLRERHQHEHTHEAIEHEHAHVHDEHHRHPHDGPVAEPHSHPHRHEPVRHSHPHLPDLHHRHQHK